MNGQDLTSLIWHGPGDPPTVAELQQAWEQMKTIKRWPNVQAFMAEFTMQELAGIGISTDPTVAALRVKLSTWLTQVNSDSDEVQLGLSKLVELGIITAQRKESILSQSP